MKKAIVLLYIVVVAVMAAATIVERYQGTDYVSEHYYGAWWFSALWALLAAAGIFWFLKQRVRRLSVVLLHLSLVVILLGALLTHLTAVRGVVPLRKGIPTNEYLTRDMYLHQLPFTICLENFEMQFYEGSDMPSNYISHVRIDDEPVTISMNNIASKKGIRLYQMDFDSDLQGSILSMNSDPWGTPVTYVGYALLFVTLVWMLADPKGGFRYELSQLRNHRTALTVFAVVIFVCFVFVMNHFLGKYSPENHPLPVLNSRLLPLHIATIMMAYTLLFFIFLSSLVGIIKSKLRQTTLHLSQLLLFPAIAFLCYGIFIGAIWANVSWGTYWSWDPKETWALITLMVYAVPAHRSIRMNRHVYMTLAFLSILITYFGVNFFLGGMHSYA